MGDTTFSYSSIDELINAVDGWTGSGYWTHDESKHGEACELIADYIRDAASDAGLTYGEDWSEVIEPMLAQDNDELYNVAAEAE